jgi:hypothetical protein
MSESKKSHVWIVVVLAAFWVVGSVVTVGLGIWSDDPRWATNAVFVGMLGWAPAAVVFAFIEGLREL